MLQASAAKFVNPALYSEGQRAFYGGRISAAVVDALRVRSGGDIANFAFGCAALARIPERFHGAVIKRFDSVASRSMRDGNVFLGQAKAAFSRSNLDLSADDASLKDQARIWVNQARSYIMGGINGAMASGVVVVALRAFITARGMVPPENATVSGILARMLDDRWWVRQLRRSACREMENQAIAFGLVHKRASVYASAEAVARREQQRRRNRRMLEKTEAVNEEGEVFTLAELSDVSTANPSIRRGELMTRIRGFEEFAESRGEVGMFLTATCPSRMHARHFKSGDQNEKWDGTTPKEAQAYLSRQWARARAWLSRRGLFIYGVRVVEPHHDGTPHWHLLLFMARDVVKLVTEKLRGIFSEENAEELSTEAARKARFEAVEIDAERGSAAGYVAKYISKNIDGAGVGADAETDGALSSADTVGNVSAWAATHGIRQFQFLGGPAVTLWRELRRAPSPQLDLFARAHAAADAGDWAGFTRAMGGCAIRRRHRPLCLWKEGAENRYGEAFNRVVGVRHGLTGERLLSRVHRWTIGGRGVGVSWTRVNNCTGGEFSTDAGGVNEKRIRRIEGGGEHDAADDSADFFQTLGGNRGNDGGNPGIERGAG